jgi:hypothetical protein
MMLNQNKAVSFYGQRPMLASQLPAHVSGRVYRDLGALGQAAAQLYMPASAGAKAVGGIMDGIGKLIKEVVYKIPLIGQVIEILVDALDLILTPMGALMEGMAIGAATYLEEPQAKAVLDDMEKNRLEYIKDAFYDCFYAFYRRIGSTNNTVLDIKQGRSAAIQGALGAFIDTTNMGRNSNRVANRVYVKAMGAGAKDWQAAAAVCYGLLTGLQTKGFPAGFSVKVKGVNIATVASGADTSKAMWALGNDFDALYFAKLGPKSDKWHSVAWIDEQYKAKSGGAIGDTKDKASGGGGGAVPLLALAAAAFLAFKK